MDRFSFFTSHLSFSPRIVALYLFIFSAFPLFQKKRSPFKHGSDERTKEKSEYWSGNDAYNTEWKRNSFFTNELYSICSRAYVIFGSESHNRIELFILMWLVGQRESGRDKNPCDKKMVNMFPNIFFFQHQQHGSSLHISQFTTTLRHFISSVWFRNCPIAKWENQHKYVRFNDMAYPALHAYHCYRSF